MIQIASSFSSALLRICGRQSGFRAALNNVIRLVALLYCLLSAQTLPAQSYTWTTWVGQALVNGSTDGTGGAARFNDIYGLTFDSTNSIVYASDNSGTVRKITSAGVVTTLAGLSGQFGSSDGTGSAAPDANLGKIKFDNPAKIWSNLICRWHNPANKLSQPCFRDDLPRVPLVSQPLNYHLVSKIVS